MVQPYDLAFLAPVSLHFASTSRDPLPSLPHRIGVGFEEAWSMHAEAGLSLTPHESAQTGIFGHAIILSYLYYEFDLFLNRFS